MIPLSEVIPHFTPDQLASGVADKIAETFVERNRLREALHRCLQEASVIDQRGHESTDLRAALVVVQDVCSRALS